MMMMIIWCEKKFFCRILCTFFWAVCKKDVHRHLIVILLYFTQYTSTVVSGNGGLDWSEWIINSTHSAQSRQQQEKILLFSLILLIIIIHTYIPIQAFNIHICITYYRILYILVYPVNNMGSWASCIKRELNIYKNSPSGSPVAVIAMMMAMYPACHFLLYLCVYPSSS